MSGFLKVVFASAIFLAPVLIGTAPVQAQLQNQVSVYDIAGRYSVAGRNPDGSIYKGSVQITDDLGDVLFVWKVGGNTFRGVGKFAGNKLVVDWGSQYPAIYTIDIDGSLSGAWENGTADETLTR